ncbi:MFS general substrate transporter [Armillaria gallica]|uniref:MFS general substrate transporter n=1 Tax=Armillaria gallica TaxID=47427 RepID=A0A2H3CW24_ARMGA|nr:MFS general substrate transporter [Armillaria gallica]
MADALSIKSKSADVESNVSIDAELAQKVLRKINWRLLLIMFIKYNFNFIDKTILSSASVFGLKADTMCIFYFGYLGWAYPTRYLIQRLPGTLVALTTACKNFGGFVTVRFLLGVAEATITPAFIYITSMWYTRDEILVKTGAWFAGNSFGGLVASLAAYGIGRIEEPLSPWQWLFIVSCHYPNLVSLVLINCLWGVIILFILPDSIESYGFLNEEEKKCAQDRVVLAGMGKASKETSQWKHDQVFECFLDPKTWFFFAISICTQIPNSSTQNFGNLVLTGFGFTSLETTLVGIPLSAILTILITGTQVAEIGTVFMIGKVLKDLVISIVEVGRCPRCSQERGLRRPHHMGQKVDWRLIRRSDTILPTPNKAESNVGYSNSRLSPRRGKCAVFSLLPSRLRIAKLYAQKSRDQPDF